MHTRTRSRDKVSVVEDTVSEAEEEEEYDEYDDVRPPIKFNALYKYFKNEAIPDTTPDVARTIRDHKKRMMQMVLKRLNEHIEEIDAKWRSASDLELYLAYKNKGADTEDLLAALDDPEFKKAIKAEARELIEASSGRKFVEPPDDSASSSDSEQRQRKCKRASLSKIKECAKQDGVRATQKAPKPRRESNLDLERPAEVSEDEWNSWSDAHRDSYLKQKVNPNTYLYRNLPPGEKPRHGSWTSQEQELFLQRLAEMRKKGIVEGKWGLFSKKIPGRVGYQCSNFYRKLIRDGVIEDPSYKFDAEGCLRYKNRTPYHKTGTRKTGGKSSVAKPRPTKLSKYEALAQNNPLKGRVDFITGEEIRVPTMSPDGNVLDYHTWMKILMDTREDPFTRHPINKRQLVVLTNENIDEYRDQIRNI